MEIINEIFGTAINVPFKAAMSGEHIIVATTEAPIGAVAIHSTRADNREYVRQAAITLANGLIFESQRALLGLKHEP